ncbi:MAG: hypothetical protein KAX78_02490, partial [Phycisphaerae bacterium]|nr:hypothetical protein [Phycisphaerae bacterium]
MSRHSILAHVDDPPRPGGTIVGRAARFYHSDGRLETRATAENPFSLAAARPYRPFTTFCGSPARKAFTL